MDNRVTFEDHISKAKRTAAAGIMSNDVLKQLTRGLSHSAALPVYNAYVSRVLLPHMIQYNIETFESLIESTALALIIICDRKISKSETSIYVDLDVLPLE